QANAARVDQVRLTVTYETADGTTHVVGPGSATSAAGVVDDGTWYDVTAAATAAEFGAAAATLVSPDASSEFLIAHGFCFSIPETARIRGIDAHVIRRIFDAGRTPVADAGVRLLAGQGFVGPDRSLPDPWLSVWQIASYG